MSLTADNLAGLVELHQSVIQASKLASLTRPGALSRLFLNESGWTADGPSRARRLLADVLRYYVEGDATAQVHGYSRHDKAAVLGLYWGVSEYPASADKARLALVTADDLDASIADTGEQEPGFRLPSLTAVRKWEEAVVSDDKVLALVNAHFSNVGSVIDIVSAGQRRPWWGYDTMVWPESRSWPPGAVGAPLERRVILDAASAIVGAEVKESRLIQALREIVIEDLCSYYPRDRCSLWFRNINPRIIEPWRNAYSNGFTVLGSADGKKVDGGARTRSIATAAQMFFHDAVAPHEAAHERLRKRVVALEALDGVRNLETGLFFEAGPRPEFFMHKSAVATLDQRRSSVSKIAAATARQRDVEYCFMLAGVIRDSTGKPSAKLVRDYLDCRRALDWDKLSVADAILVELADQSVHLDLVRMRDATLVDELGDLIVAHPHTAAGYAYMVLINRENSLIHNKNHQYAEATLDIEQGFVELRELGRQGLLNPKAELEAFHQLALAGAGIFVRLLEAQIRRAQPQPTGAHPSMRTWAIRALTYVQIAREKLHALESQGLAARRHDDGSISSVAWRVQTEIIALRVQLAVLTARESGLIPVSSSTSVRTAEDAVDLSTMCGEYRQLVSRQELPASAAEEVVKLGLWLALLNGGMLPLAPDLAPTLNNISFIDGVPDHGDSERLVDLEASGRWLQMRGHDAGILSYLSADNPAAGLLDRVSKSLYLNELARLPRGKRAHEAHTPLSSTSYTFFART